MYEIVKEKGSEIPTKKIDSLSNYKIYVVVDVNLRVSLISDFYNNYGEPKIGGSILGLNTHSNRCFFSDSYNEFINKIQDPYKLYEFNTLKEFAEAVIKYGWKNYGE